MPPNLSGPRCENFLQLSNDSSKNLCYDVANMNKQTVYLETTVPNYVFNDNYPDEHIVRESTISKVTAINTLLGYKTPKIVNPEEVIFDVLEQKI